MLSPMKVVTKLYLVVHAQVNRTNTPFGENTQNVSVFKTIYKVGMSSVYL
jgi:hypothetical protein